MNRREFILGSLATMVSLNAWAAPNKKARLKWMALIKGCLCTGCGNKLRDQLLTMPGVVHATVNVESGDVEIFSADERTGEKIIRETIGKTNFKVVSIKGPVKI